MLLSVALMFCQDKDAKPMHTNRLIHETSPYLQQHAHNPVDWYPWGEEALKRARDEDRPIFLSIGYAACHWCHVMEHECFENEQIAAVMNESFINIKVDREERPDLDEIYMSAVQLMTGGGGWPMSVFLTPDLKPFYGGTYFPPEDRWGRPGFPTLVKALAKLYQDRRSDVTSQADEVLKRIAQMGTMSGGDALPGMDAIAAAVEQLESQFDPRFAGFGQAPKFPHSMDIMLLLRYAQRRDRKDAAQALDMAERTLKAMARGGMYDHLGGGFHRYSTDERWLIPHFEKMLYDNALLARTYAEAFQLAHDPFYERVVRETCDYVLREMRHPEGGFYSTQDADSEGEEGRFFAWTREQIEAELGKDDAVVFCAYYAVAAGGNFEHGTSVLSTPRPLEEVARDLKRPPEECAKILERSRAKLFLVREQRVHPARDEKILTAWNGLMIGALAKASLALGEPRYRTAAEDAARFVLAKLRKDGRLLRSFRDGTAKLNGYLDDHAFLMQGLIDLYQATFDVQWLVEARAIEALLAQRFFDREGGGYFFVSDDHEQLIHRSKDPYDGATPSGNSVATCAALQLFELTGDEALLGRAEKTLKLYAPALAASPRAFPQMLLAVDFHVGPRQTLVLLGEDAAMLRVASDSFRPRLTLAGVRGGALADAAKIAAILEGRTLVGGRPTAYLCEGFACKAPVTSAEALRAQLGP